MLTHKGKDASIILVCDKTKEIIHAPVKQIYPHALQLAMWYYGCTLIGFGSCSYIFLSHCFETNSEQSEGNQVKFRLKRHNLCWVISMPYKIMFVPYKQCLLDIITCFKVKPANQAKSSKIFPKYQTINKFHHTQLLNHFAVHFSQQITTYYTV